MFNDQIYKNAIKLTRDLIRTPSESSNPLATEGPAEAGMITFLSKICKENQLTFTLQEALPDRHNLIISLPKKNAPKVLFLAHMDTVSAKEMPHPFSADLTNDTISGRGACDDKGPLSSLLATLIELNKSKEKQNFDVTFVCTVDEESTMAGAAMFAKKNSHKYDICIALEPSLLQPISKHKGAYRCRIIPAIASETSPPEEYIQKKQKIIQDILADLAAFKKKTQKLTDPKLGQADITLTEIKGSSTSNKGANTHRVLVDIRMLPSQSPAQIHKEISQIIGTRGKIIPLYAGLGIDSNPDDLYIKKFQTSIQRQGFSDNLIALPFPSDCSQLRNQSTCIVWGPGNPELAHKSDESIEVSQLEGACRVLLDFLAS